jgi:CRP/FNR family transcriptional regulator
MAKFSKTADCRTCGLKTNLFCYMTDDQLSRVNDERKEVTFQPGETIFKSGGPLTHILCLTKGMAKVYIEEPGERRVLLNLVKPVQLIGGPGFLVDNRHYVTVTALEETRACYIDANDFKDVMKSNAEFSMELVKYLNKRIINYFEKINCLSHKHMHGKLATSLLYLADEVYGNLSFETRLNRQDFADLSGMTKESVIRILKEFKEEGILNYNTTHFEIKKKEQLIKIAKTG